MNVVLITIDCLRYDRCGFNGYSQETTPTLTQLIEESYIFDHAYATGPYTTESVPGILAGQHSYNGTYFGEDPAWKAIDPNSTTIAGHLERNGYNTIATVTNPHLTTARNFDTGFDDFRNLRTDGVNKAERDPVGGGTLQNSVINMLQERFRQSSRRISPVVLAFLFYRYYQYKTNWPTVDAEAVIKGLCSQLAITNAPFFAWGHLMDPHAPISPQVVENSGDATLNKRGTLRQLHAVGNHARELQDSEYHTLYDNSIRYVDAHINKLISELRSNDRWEETILIVTGDHGEVLNDRLGICGHPRHHHYDESLHVPLLVRVPNIDGYRIQRPVSLAAIPALITEIVDIPRGNFPATEAETSVIAGEESNHPILSDSLDKHGHTVSVRGDKHKLITHSSDNNTLEVDYPYFEDNEIFDYKVDPAERQPIVSSSSKELYAVAESVMSDYSSLPNIQGRFSTTVERRLEDLGYRME